MSNKPFLFTSKKQMQENNEIGLTAWLNTRKDADSEKAPFLSGYVVNSQGEKQDILGNFNTKKENDKQADILWKLKNGDGVIASTWLNNHNVKTKIKQDEGQEIDVASYANPESGEALSFFKKEGSNKPAVEMYGKDKDGGTTRIALWSQMSSAGKPFFSGKMTKADKSEVKIVGNHTSFEKNAGSYSDKYPDLRITSDKNQEEDVHIKAWIKGQNLFGSDAPSADERENATEFQGHINMVEYAPVVSALKNYNHSPSEDANDDDDMSPR